MSFESQTLASGTKMPSVGLGFWKVGKDVCADVVQTACDIGYRHLDCACDYGNEVEVGHGIKRVLDGGLSRDDLWVTTKLWNTFHKHEHVRPACERQLSDLGLDHIDLYLVHFPISLKYVPFDERYPPEWTYDPSAETPRMEYEKVTLAETWAAMEELKDAGLVREIGISNYNIGLIRETLAGCRIRPAALQVELHPYLTQETLLRYCEQENIAVTGFSPIGAKSYVPIGMAEESDSVLEEPVVKQIAARLDKIPVQVVLRWGIQRGTSIVPKSTSEAHLRENLNIFDWELSSDDMSAIASLNKNKRFNDPVDFGQAAFNTFFPIYE